VVIIIFIDRTSTYTITFMHHRDGRLGLGLVWSLETSQKIFSAAEVISVALLAEYCAQKHQAKFRPCVHIKRKMHMCKNAAELR